MSGTRLHVGCGGDIRPGYINIDEFNPAADVRMRIQDLSYPSNSIDRIEGYMVLEHLSPDDAVRFASNSFRMLKEGGVLVLECPDLLKVCRLIIVFKDDLETLERGAFGLRGLFGEPTGQMTLGDYHKWGYTPALAEAFLRGIGFAKVDISDGMSHQCPIRDMRIEAVK